MSEPVGYITFLFVDAPNNMFVELGGAGFDTDGELDAEWEFCSVAANTTRAGNYQAVRLDADGDEVASLDVPSRIIEHKMGSKITELIALGRMRLAAERDAFNAALTRPKQSRFVPRKEE